MILGIILLVVGIALMLLGVMMLWEWLSGVSRFFESSGRDKSMAQSDWVLMDLHFLALVIAPLLGGAIMIVFGLIRIG